MADRLTQIQDCLDQLLTQMYATIKYIDSRHAYGSIPGQWLPPPTSTDATNSSALATTAGTGQADGQQQQQQQQQVATVVVEASGMEPQADALFEQRMQELAQDLVVKEQQIEALVATLPGVGSSQAKQERRLAELQSQLDELDEEAKEWAGQKGALVELLEGRLEGIMRV